MMYMIILIFNWKNATALVKFSIVVLYLFRSYHKKAQISYLVDEFVRVVENSHLYQSFYQILKKIRKYLTNIKTKLGCDMYQYNFHKKMRNCKTGDQEK